jgi:Raf kinase inhibitor-like YbhB/YbcL family protein
MKIQLTSSVFAEGQIIPKQHTADGSNTSPPLTWSGLPEGTQSIALICDDPDAPRGIWVHWVLFNLPAEVSDLAEGVSPRGALPDGTQQGKNDFGKIGYGGPAPPKGKPHRYFFKIYAVDKVLDLAAGSTKEQLLAALKGHVLADGQLMGKYAR